MIATALSIAGSDPSGGAGIQADLKTFADRGVYGMAVLTALTAQSTVGVTGVHPVPPAFIRQQLATLFDDMPAGAVKIGMLATADIIRGGSSPASQSAQVAKNRSNSFQPAISPVNCPSASPV